ncbi:MAG: hypothetical protein GXY72_15035 [Deltaproteobacteria bacterium]|nr:hypothetical protein [Deltaproteobacteria bacterium]
MFLWFTAPGKRRSIILLIALVLPGIFFFQGSVSSNDDHASIAIDDDPRMLALNPATNRAVVTHRHSNTVSIVDLNTEKIITKLHVGRMPKGVAIDAELNIAVVTHQGERSVTLIDLNNNRVAADIHVGNVTGGIAINSRTHIAAITSATDFHICFLDILQKKIIAKTPVGLHAGDIAVDPERNAALLLNPVRTKLIMIDMNTYRICDSIDLERRPQAIDVNPKTNTALITNYHDHSITEIDLLSRRHTLIHVAKFPLDVAFNSIDNRAVILCDRDRKLLLLNLDTSKIIKTYSLPRHPQCIAVNSLKNIAIVADDEKDGLTIIPLLLSPTLPKIKITSPLDNAQILSDTVTVSGIVKNSSNVTVNGVAATVSAHTFTATLTFKAGKNTISAIATDQYGRTDCYNITVDIALPAAGKVTGVVSNAVTGGLLPLAIVTITDAEGNTQTIATGISGTFTAEVAPGAFAGTVIKPWYLPNSFAGSVTAGETAITNTALTPVDPEISNISVSDVTSTSAKISWATDQPTQGAVQYGTTTSYGSAASDAVENTAHSLTLAGLSPATTYHFRIAAASSNGTTIYSGDSAFKTSGKIDITITSPTAGTTISGSSVMVNGSIANAVNAETGVTINGIAASLNNNQFALNDVPLTEGQNTITATAKDINGTTATKSITVNAAIPQNFIEMSAYPDSGIAPMEVTLRINGTFSIGNPTITFTGASTVEQLVSDNPEEYKYKLTTEGVYYFTAQVTGPDGNNYADKIAVTVLPLNIVDTLLKSKWTGMTEALQRGDPSSALNYILPSRRENYEVVFTVLKDHWTSITASYRSFTLISMEASVARYELAAVKNGRTYVYQIDFRQDASGLWFVDEF